MGGGETIVNKETAGSSVGGDLVNLLAFNRNLYLRYIGGTLGQRYVTARYKLCRNILKCSLQIR